LAIGYSFGRYAEQNPLVIWLRESLFTLVIPLLVHVNLTLSSFLKVNLILAISDVMVLQCLQSKQLRCSLSLFISGPLVDIHCMYRLLGIRNQRGSFGSCNPCSLVYLHDWIIVLLLFVEWLGYRVCR